MVFSPLSQQGGVMHSLGSTEHLLSSHEHVIRIAPLLISTTWLRTKKVNIMPECFFAYRVCKMYALCSLLLQQIQGHITIRGVHEPAVLGSPPSLRQGAPSCPLPNSNSPCPFPLVPVPAIHATYHHRSARHTQRLNYWGIWQNTGLSSPELNYHPSHGGFLAIFPVVS